MENKYRKAYSEVSVILKKLKKEDYEKIPDKFLKLIERKKDKKYKFVLDDDKNIVEQNVLEETKAILAVLYNLYLSDNRKIV